MNDHHCCACIFLSTGDDLTSDLQLKEMEEKLRKEEMQFEEAQKLKEEAESKLSEAQRRARSLRHHMDEQKAQLSRLGNENCHELVMVLLCS